MEFQADMVEGGETNVPKDDNGRCHSFSQLPPYSFDEDEVERNIDTTNELPHGKAGMNRTTWSKQEQQRRPSWLAEVKLKPVGRSNHVHPRTSLGHNPTTTKAPTETRASSSVEGHNEAKNTSKAGGSLMAIEKEKENQQPGSNTGGRGGTKRILQVKAMFECDNVKKYDFDTPSPMYKKKNTSWTSYQSVQLSKQRQQQRRHSSFNSPTSWQTNLNSAKKKKKSSLPMSYQMNNDSHRFSGPLVRDQVQQELIQRQQHNRTKPSLLSLFSSFATATADDIATLTPTNTASIKHEEEKTTTAVPEWKQKLLQKNKSNRYSTPSHPDKKIVEASKANDEGVSGVGGPLLRDQVQQDLIQRDLYKTSAETPSPGKTHSYQEFVKEQQKKNLSSLLSTPVQESTKQPSDALFETKEETKIDSANLNEDGSPIADFRESEDNHAKANAHNSQGHLVNISDEVETITREGNLLEEKKDDEARSIEEQRIKAEAAAILKAKMESRLTEEKRLAEEARVVAKEEARQRLAELKAQEHAKRVAEEFRVLEERRIAEEEKVKASDNDAQVADEQLFAAGAVLDVREDVSKAEEMESTTGASLVVVLIQSWWRMKKQRQLFSLLRQAAQTLQSRRRLLVSSRRSTSATRIQSLFRRFTEEARLKAGAVLQMAEEKTLADKARVSKERNCVLEKETRGIDEAPTEETNADSIIISREKGVEGGSVVKPSPEDPSSQSMVSNTAKQNEQVVDPRPNDKKCTDFDYGEEVVNTEGERLSAETTPTEDDEYEEITVEDDETFETVETLDEDETIDDCNLSDLVEDEEDSSQSQQSSDRLDQLCTSLEEFEEEEEVMLFEAAEGQALEMKDDTGLLPSPTSVFGFDDGSTGSCNNSRDVDFENTEGCLDDSLEDAELVALGGQEESLAQVAGEGTDVSEKNGRSSNKITLMFEAIMEQLSYHQEEEESGRKTPRMSNTGQKVVEDDVDFDSVKEEKHDDTAPIAIGKPHSVPSFSVPGIGTAMHVLSATTAFFFPENETCIAKETSVLVASEESTKDDVLPEVVDTLPVDVKREDSSKSDMPDPIMQEPMKVDEVFEGTENTIGQKASIPATDAPENDREEFPIVLPEAEASSDMSLLMSKVEYGALLEDVDSPKIQKSAKSAIEGHFIVSASVLDAAICFVSVVSVLYLWVTFWQGSPNSQTAVIFAPVLDYLPMAFALLFCTAGHIVTPTESEEHHEASSPRMTKTIACVAIRVMIVGLLIGLWMLCLSELSPRQQSSVVSASLNYIPMLSVIFLSSEDDKSTLIASQYRDLPQDAPRKTSTSSLARTFANNFVTNPVVKIVSLLGCLALCLVNYQELSPILGEDTTRQALEYFPIVMGLLVSLGFATFSDSSGKASTTSTRTFIVLVATVLVKTLCTGLMFGAWAWFWLSSLTTSIQHVVISQAFQAMGIPLILFQAFEGDHGMLHIGEESGETKAAPKHAYSSPQTPDTDHKTKAAESRSNVDDTAILVLLALMMILWVMCWTVVPESKAIAFSSNALLGGYFAYLVI